MIRTDAVRTVRPKLVASRRRRAESREDGHEGGRQAGNDEHVQGQLGQHERGVVDIQLAAGSKGAREGPVAHQAHDVAGERQRGEQDDAARQELAPRRVADTG